MRNMDDVWARTLRGTIRVSVSRQEISRHACRRLFAGVIMEGHSDMSLRDKACQRLIHACAIFSTPASATCGVGTPSDIAAG